MINKMGRKAIDISGQIFNNLLVLERDYNNPDKQHAYWMCQCQNCGKIKSIQGSRLSSGEIKSCNCIRPERIRDLTGQKFGLWTVLERDLDYSVHQKNSHTVYWKCQCECGTIRSIRADSLINGDSLSCGCNKYSKGEEKITQILCNNNINYEPQKLFDNCRFPDTNCMARFDFYLPDYNTLIEYDGKQHFESSNTGWNTKKNLEIIQKRDQFKNNWCKKNNIQLIRIPYIELRNITLEMLLPETSQYLIN